MLKKKSTPFKVTKEQVLAIPELLKTKTVSEIAVHMGITQPAVSYWLKRLQKRGIKYPKQRSGRKPLL